jgi:chorismate mutase
MTIETPVRQVLPFIVAITGKRALQGKEKEVREALEALFDRIDRACAVDDGPDVDRILLTGAAQGADTIAAEAVRSRKGWSTIAILPLEKDLFQQDFSDPGDLKRLDSLLAAATRQLTLKPLLAGPGSAPLEAASLARRADGNPARTAHYEQLGLFLAEHAALLIAVQPLDAEAGRTGGTGRVVEYRLTGQVDAVSADVVARSEELAAPPKLADSCDGPVWLVDLSSVGEGASAAFRVQLAGDREARAASEDSISGSLTQLEWLRKLNSDAAALPEEDWRTIEKETPPSFEAAGALRRARRIMTLIQRREKSSLIRSVRWLAILFCAAIVSYETYIELRFYSWSHYSILFYLGFAVAALIVYGWAKRESVQADAENYRSLGEALRIQLLWWDVGLAAPEYRVDRHFLQSAPPSLRAARDGLAQALNAARLIGPLLPSPGAAEAFIAVQRKYFADRILERETSIKWTEHASWFLFIVSLTLAACIVVVEFASGLLPVSIVHGHADRVTAQLALLAVPAALLLGLISFGQGAFSAEPGILERRPARWIGPSLAALAGLVIAAGLYGLACWLPLPGGHHEGGGAEAESFVWHATRDLIAMATILAAAIAGALRFIAEKLSWSAELSGYLEAAERFRRGDRVHEAARTDDDRRAIVLELGLSALRENEAWLRAHRERPLEPLTG